MEPYLRAWHDRFRGAEEERARQASRARTLLPELVRHLVERYRVRRIWLFGSLADGFFRENSDIDLAVEGLPGGTALFRAGAELDDLARPFRVDLVPLEEAWAPVRERVLTKGQILHDAGSA